MTHLPDGSECSDYNKGTSSKEQREAHTWGRAAHSALKLTHPAQRSGKPTVGNNWRDVYSVNLKGLMLPDRQLLISDLIG